MTKYYQSIEMVIKIGFYLRNASVGEVDLSHPEGGNPGVGGTHFLIVSLSYYFNKYLGDEIKPIIFANEPNKLPDEIRSYRSTNASEALSQSSDVGVDFFIWRPTDDAEGCRLLRDIPDSNIKVICWMHNIIKAKFLHRLDSLGNVSGFVYVGREQLELLRDCGSFDSSTFIFNGFDSNKYKPQVIKSDGKTVCYIGSLIPAKGFHILAQLWPDIQNRVPNAKLRILGTGKLYDRSQQLGRWGIAEESYERRFRPYLQDGSGYPHASVSFEGLVSSSRKVELLQHAAVGVANPSGKTANCPGSAIEIQACGTPAVSIARRGMFDVIQHNKTGLLGKSDTEIREHVITLLQSESLRNKMGKNGIEFVESRFNFQNICGQWLKLFQRIIANQPLTQPNIANSHHKYKNLKQSLRTVKTSVPLASQIPCTRRLRDIGGLIVR